MTSSSNPIRAPQQSTVLPDGTTQDDEVTFISGITSTGTVAGRSFSTWDSSAGPTGKGIDANGNGYYGTQTSGVLKWNSDNTSTSVTSTAGTTGGTLTYYFDPSANWTSAEKTALTSGLDLWHQVADISFAETQNSSAANVTFKRNTTNDAFFQSGAYTQPAIGSTALSHPGTDSFITLDTASGSYGTLGDFNNGGYGIQVVLHEEGHLLGLGHGGPYNGDKTPNQQFTPYDNRAYAIMSYFNPDDSKQYASPVTTVYNGQNATTWMPLDIDAIQRLYGVQTNAQLNQAQTFGYNTTVTGSLKPYFDFTTINTPVLTLYDTAASGNRLDLSGSSAVSNVNMNPGTYSSTHGLSNNIAIYKSTYIQSAVTGSGNDSITVNLRQNNQIDGGGGSNTAVFAGNAAEYDYTTVGGVTTVTRARSADTSARPNAVVDTLTNVQTLQFADRAETVCFASGTLIRTVSGDVAVEDLAVGDLVLTRDGRRKAIRWIGHRHVACARHPEPASVYPVRVRAGSFGDGLPYADLWLSRNHALCLDNSLVPVRGLIDGDRIAQVPQAEVTYWHVELDGHDVILANGLPAESYLDTGNRRGFANAEASLLHFDEAPAEGYDGSGYDGAGYCLPMVESGPLLSAIRARYGLGRAAPAGTYGGAEAAVHLVADEAVLLPCLSSENELRFLLPAGAGDLRLVSPSFPAGGSDIRRLGVIVGGLAVSDGAGWRDVPLDDAGLYAGFHLLEREAGKSWRWTDGEAHLAPSLWAGLSGPVLLRITGQFSGFGAMPADEADEARAAA